MYLGQNHSTDSGEGRNKRSVQEFDLDIWNRNISCSLYTGSLFEKSEQIGPKRAKILSRFIAQIYFDLELWHRNVVQGQSTPFNKRQSFNNIIEHDWPRGKESIIKKWISKRPTLTFTVDLEKWFKITTHPLPTLTLHVNYKPDRANGENAWSRQVI